MRRNKEINNLIRLLDDRDEEIYNHIEEKILSLGPEVIPILEEEWSRSMDTILQQRIERLVHQIQLDSLKAELKIWSINEPFNLKKGALLATRFQYPDLNEKKLLKEIEKIKRDVWLELNDDLTALEKVKVLNHIFFDVHGFAGNTLNYHAPQNSFLNNVIESKKGNPLSLSILYSIVAQELHIPIYGVNLPEHFVLAYLGTVTEEESDDKEKKKKTATKILFYINAFSKGSVFSSADIDSFLRQLKINPLRSYYEPCNNVAIIQRLFRNLIFSYEKLGYKEKVIEIESLMNSLD